MDKKDEKKQIPLRLSKRLYEELSAWAEDDFRSLNGQIEYLLTEAVLSHRKKKPQSTDVTAAMEEKNNK